MRIAPPVAPKPRAGDPECPRRRPFPRRLRLRLLPLILALTGALLACARPGSVQRDEISSHPAPVPGQSGEVPGTDPRDRIRESLDDGAYKVLRGAAVDYFEAADAVERIHRSVGWEHFNWHVLSNLERTLFLRDAKGRLVGYVLLERNGYLPNIATERDYQGKGVGFRLILEAMMQARREGLAEVRFFYRGNNPKTVAFFDKVARSVPVKQRVPSGAYENGDPRILMVIDLTPFDAYLAGDR